MTQNELRTYRRRETTRQSGYHTHNGVTGSECVIRQSQRLIQSTSCLKLTFTRHSLKLVELFESETGILAFGGYIRSKYPAKIGYSLSLSSGGETFEYEKEELRPVAANLWTSIGFHKEISLTRFSNIDFAQIILKIESTPGNTVDFISFDFDVIQKKEYTDRTLAKSFYQKTALHVPYLYYLKSDLPVTEYLEKELPFTAGSYVVLKSCNRCGRFLPIDLENEMNSLSFSLHCKKRAPCIHSSFRAYTVLNRNSLIGKLPDNFKLSWDSDKAKVLSYYGHQLECKACKKFFVNAPLNPQRNPQQFKEDGLRRRAIEVLVNELLNRNLVHFEFESRTKKQFSQHIWHKFGCRCFKCQIRLPLEEMHLDYTMPLAYLYRLDESATCLCSHHNAQKRDHFPVDFYTEEELIRLSGLTGLSLERLHSRSVNEEVLSLLTENVVWYFDEFLMRKDYQKKRDGILTADKINDSLKRVIEGKVDLAEEYKKVRGVYPFSVTINQPEDKEL